MDKQEFNKLEILQQLEYVNNELIKGKSLREISSSLEMSKTTFRDRFIKIGYIFNKPTKQYIKDNSIPKEVKCKHNTNILQKNENIDNKAIAKHEYKSNIDIFSDKDTKNKMLEIIGQYDDIVKMIEVSENIKEMLEWYSKQKNIINIEPSELKIDSNKLNGEVKTTTVRLYSEVWEQFREFMEGYKEYKSMDLISMALVEYIKKYKK